MRLLRLTAIPLFILLLSGCRPASVLKIADTDPAGWLTLDTARIEYPNKGQDTSSRRDIGLILRFDNNFQHGEIPLSIRVETPDSLWYEEAFTAHITEIKRINKDFREASLPYRTDVVFDKPGTYVFLIATHHNGIAGIWGVGLTSTPAGTTDTDRNTTNATNNDGQE